MRVLLKDDVIVLIPESSDETLELDGWRAAHIGHVFCAESRNAHALELHGLGKRAEACRESVNAVSSSPDPLARMIGNFATAPFDLDGQRYLSVESFWQGLKFGSDSERRRLAQLEGPRARAEGDKQGGRPWSRHGSPAAPANSLHPLGYQPGSRRCALASPARVSAGTVRPSPCQPCKAWAAGFREQ
jgi:hypothetical protein